MPFNVILTIPHPLDDIVNFALYLLSTETSSDDRFLLHKETNDAPFQRRIRRLLRGAPAGRSSIIEEVNWTNRVCAESPYVHFYNRFSLGDQQFPPSQEHIESYLELCSLHLHSQEYALTFVDFGGAPSNARALWPRHDIGDIETNGVNQLASSSWEGGHHRREWSFSPEHLAERARAILGPDKLQIVLLSGSDNCNIFLSRLFDQICFGRHRGEVIKTDHSMVLLKLSQRLQRRVHEVA